MSRFETTPAGARHASRLVQAAGAAPAPDAQRPAASGKLLYVDGKTLWVRGVTYGTFRPGPQGAQYPTLRVVARDFALMTASGINAVRTYTVPPGYLLDAASTHGLRVMVGLPWEQHVAFLGDRRRARAIVERLRDGVRACADHPAVLCYAIGNEIPAPIVRWHGRRAVERFLAELADAARGEDPAGLVTYVNYPTTEYLELPFLDFACFNVYLESAERLDAYLARLQTLAGDRPLVLAELGLDSRGHGQFVQARAVERQVRAAFSAGCAGAFVFAWTDEWHRGGHDVLDWDFGLTDRRRRPKPSLAAVQRAFEETPFPPGRARPRVSVVVCSYNGARTLADCLDGLARLEYPDYEVIVVDDGSTDATAALARRYEVRVISTPNRGLSSARNTGLAHASGEIVAYIDDDAWPDPHWLTYLVETFLTTTHDGVGGPNIPPPGDGPIAACVAAAPGGPTHVLVSDTEAEHVPGCNMAFRRQALAAIGGFDPRFRTAGDDVDVCWRLQQAGGTLGFSPAAVVWHHRRNSVRAYWRQQMGYGRAEALLERKWPEKYNGLGHATWAGRVYGGAAARLSWRQARVYQGTWGSALFQSLYQPAPDTLASLVAMPEWYLVVAALAALSALGALWAPLLAALPLLALATAAPVAVALAAAMRARFPQTPSPARRAGLRGLTALLHLVQPLARLRGRIRHGLTPWRRNGPTRLAAPWPQRLALWTEQWQEPAARLTALEEVLRADGVVVARGGAWDRWDLDVRGGLLGGARMRLAVEEHGAGRQLTQLSGWPRCSLAALAGLPPLGCAVAAAAAGAPVTASILGVSGMLLTGRAVLECARALGLVRAAWGQLAAQSGAVAVRRTARRG
ncbi:MAG: glycosyltransferase [Candidatus Rokuibacteriota bacterium]